MGMLFWAELNDSTKPRASFVETGVFTDNLD